MIKNKVALISVFNKKGVSKFAETLKKAGYKIVATNGTGKELAKNKIDYIPVKKISRNPMGFDNFIKTISFYIQAGILFNRSNSIYIKQMKKLNIEKIDIVVCNFATFKKVIKKPSDFNIKNIDIGGPLMVRAAATNFKYVLIIIDPHDYKRVSEAILKNKVTNKLRQQLAIKAFFYTYSYDYEIAKYLKTNNINLLKY